MNLDDLDSHSISKLISVQVEQVSCIECCKYYIAPETAPCGHALCHGCWSGRRTCPHCQASVTRRSLRLNEPLRHLTEHVHALVEKFENLFNVKLEELNLDTVQPLLPKDSTKHVSDWLTSSNNHFSAPIISSQSQMSLMDVPPPIELDASKVQIHSHTKKITSPKKVIHAPQPQDDWDKIETIADTEELVTKNKENIVGPRDIEPYVFDDNEYNNERPRRSNRKKDTYPPARITRTRSRSIDKFSSKNSSETEKKTTKPKQNWSNVKKMKKEFNKLNKANKNKLNISIEMSKKAQENKVSKGSDKELFALKTPDNDKGSLIEDDMGSEKIIEEPVKNKNMSQMNNENMNPNINETVNQVEKNHLLINKSKKKSRNKPSLDIPNKTTDTSKHVTTNKSQILERSSDKQTSTEDLPPYKDCQEPIFHRSGRHSLSNQESDVQVVQNITDSQSNTDDVHISIKIGSTVTNILIKQKNKDASFKINTDSAIQTSLGPDNLQGTAMCDKSIDAQSGIPKETSEKGVSVNMIEVELGPENKVTVNKVLTSKVDTASAETATAQYEITNSVEKEMSDAMDCEYECNKALSVKLLKQLTEKSQEKPKQKDVDHIEEDMDEIIDYDLFASGSVKEADVHLLKDAKEGHSEILKPTLKSTKSLKDKRNRDDGDELDIPRNKRARVNSLQNENTNTQKLIEMEQDSDPTYDKVMSQVFANIDADIQSSKKSCRNLSLKQTEKERHKNESQIIQKTQRRTPKEVSPQNIVPNVEQPQKDSENIFSFMENTHQEVENPKKNNEISEINIESQKMNRPSARTKSNTQQNIDSILTPGLTLGTFKSTTHQDFDNAKNARDQYQEIAKNSTQNTDHLDTLQGCAQAEKDLGFKGDMQEKTDEDMMPLQPVLGTPLMEDDDSDKSVVEETPQKNMSFLKPKARSDAQNPGRNDSTKGATGKKSDENNSDSQISTSVINISDTETVIETLQKGPAAETPMSISRFVNQIQHNSTPMAKKSLNFDSDGLDDPEQTLCPPTTQEREFMEKAFEKTPVEIKDPVRKPLMARNECVRNTSNFCIAGSCLSTAELTKIKILCKNKGWTFSDKYTDQLTHLVVTVDAEFKSQRTVKYMCALAASKWIVSFAWIEKCFTTKAVPDETPYEALDACGDPGPARSRQASCKLFNGFTFFLMPPFTILDVDTLKHLITRSGGRVVSILQDVRVTGRDVKILLAEPETTQEDRFIYMTMKEGIVPVNYEWVLNCLGMYSLCTIKDLLLCPVTLLSPHVEAWPQVLMQENDEGEDME